MSVIATAVRHLMAAGVTGDALLDAIGELEAEVRAEPKPRSAGAIRTERWRRNKASHVTECDAGDESDAPPLSRPPNEEKSNPPTHTPGDVNTTRARNDPFPRPDWCSSQLWLDLKANRKAKRLACTPTAHAKLLRDLDAMADDDWPPGRLLEAIVARGWAAAAHDPREAPRNGISPRRSDLRQAVSPRGERPNRCLDMLYAAEAEIRAGDDPQPDLETRPPLRAIASG